MKKSMISIFCALGLLLGFLTPFDVEARAVRGGRGEIRRPDTRGVDRNVEPIRLNPIDDEGNVIYSPDDSLGGQYGEGQGPLDEDKEEENKLFNEDKP